MRISSLAVLAEYTGNEIRYFKSQLSNIKLSSLPPLNSAFQGETHRFVCGGITPGKEV